MISPTPTRLKDPNGYTHYGHGDDEGYFFLYLPRDGGVQNTFHCREELACGWDEDHPRNRWLGFMWNDRIMVRRTERLWTELETKMGVTDHTIFHRVTDDDGEDGAPSIEKTQVLLHLSPFWTKSQTHRSVCSLLLRLLVVHYTDSLPKAIQSYDLARRCAAALNHFLAGNTKPAYRRWNHAYELWLEGDGSDDEPNDLGCGFSDEFYQASTEDIKRKLVKP